jgi:superfamily II DNA or RNA helicase
VCEITPTNLYQLFTTFNIMHIMQYQLRDYQEQLINQIFGAWAEGSRRVMALWVK